jgi:MscS family membrane protein
VAAAPNIAPDSPRASLQRFLDLSRETRFSDAAAYLDLTAVDAARGPELARRLKAVLDHYVWFDLSTVSSLPGGNAEDALPGLEDQVASIPGDSGPAAVRMAKRGEHWRFTAETVQRIDGWFAGLGNAWVIDHLPKVLLRPGPRELQWWQWLGLGAIGAVSWLLGLLLGALSWKALQRIAARTQGAWDNAVVERLRGPFSLGWFLVVAGALVSFLELYGPAQAFIDRWLHIGLFVVFFWALLRSIEVVGKVLAGSEWAREHPASRSLVPLGARTSKVAVWAMAVIAVLSELGYPVASLIAGLGIGGLVLALAGQKTVENLFGAFSIGIDQPFREGDFVKVEDFVGTVERIGLRSTRIRTLDRTVISLPNGRLSDMRLESFAERDRIKFAITAGLTRQTTARQMREVLAGWEAVFRAHPKIWPDSVTVRFSTLGTSSLDIDVMVWFQTADWGEFIQIRQDVLLQLMEVVERAGTSFAYPTQTLHLSPDAQVAGALEKTG